MTEQVLVPDVGEAEDIEVIEVLVKVGDTVAVDDSLVVLESDKASMEIPSPLAGVVASVNVSEGDKVEEGGLIVELETETASAEPSAKEEPSADKEPSAEPEPTPSASQTVAVPDVGDAVDITVTEILVKPGDHIEADDSLVVLESDKASMEIPSPVAGEILEVLVKDGDEVNEGDPLVKVKTSAAVESAASAETNATTQPEPAASEEAAPKKTAPKENAPKEAAQVPSKESVTEMSEADVELSNAKTHAGPAVRKQAREYGVDLTEVKATGKKSRVLKEDIQTFVKQRLKAGPAANAGGSGIPPIPTVDFAKFGEIELTPMSRIKQATARNLHRSWLNVPHVTQFDEADITEMEAFRKAQNDELKAQGLKLTPMAFLVKACVTALQAYPQFNASLEAGYKNLILKKYYNIGVAVETPDGLVVPVIKDADQKGILQLAEETSALAAKARDKKLPMDAMQGATFTISSLGGIGGTKFTPIVNAPEVAILGVSKAKVAPLWNGESFVPRTMLPLSLSYDHRAIDGAEAARFANYLAKVLTDVRKMLL